MVRTGNNNLYMYMLRNLLVNTTTMNIYVGAIRQTTNYLVNPVYMYFIDKADDYTLSDILHQYA